MLRKLALACTFVLAFAVPAFAGEQPTEWMRDYVDMRAALQAGDVAEPPPGVTPRIIGGDVAEATLHPFQVALVSKYAAPNGSTLFCGGTLIRSRFVVTAAHCSDFVFPGMVQVIVGARLSEGDSKAKLVDVKAIRIHPKWDKKKLDYDVAVWELAKDVTGIPFATLATRDPPVNTRLTVTGWGATIPDGNSLSLSLQKATLLLNATRDCSSKKQWGSRISNRMLCASVPEGGISPCRGDSGGPLTAGPDNTRLVGIVSWGYKYCGLPGKPAVFTRVSNSDILNFINQAMRPR